MFFLDIENTLLLIIGIQETKADVGIGLPSHTCITEINGETVLKEGSCNSSKAFGLVMQNLVSSLTGVSGAVAVALIVYGGFRYIMAGGNPKELEKAKSILFYAGLGLFVILSTYLITSLVITALGTAT